MTKFNRQIPAGALVVALLAGCGKSGESPHSTVEIRDGHQRMLALLKQVERESGENRFLGDSVAIELREKLASLPTRYAASERFQVNVALSDHELRLGRTQTAIQRLLDAKQLLEEQRDRFLNSSDKQTQAEFFKTYDPLLFRLGVAYLRLAETENCIHCQTGESCVLPLRGGGIHSRPRGARNAIRNFTQLLERQPDHLMARWLLNIASMAVGEYPDGVPSRFLVPPAAFESEEEFPEFTNVAANLGLNTFTLSGGTVVDDFDNDGLLDVVVSTWNTAGQLRYYRNNGDGTFSERTKQAGLTGLLGGLNMVQADYDNDGDTDIFVQRGAWLNTGGRHPNSLLQNDGRGRFKDVTFDAGLGEVHYPTQTAAWADFDNDGDLDLYIGNESTGNERFACQLFENNGDGTFTDVALQAGVENNCYTKGVVWGDYDNDRFPDLYVSNLEEENRLYRNNGDGTFTDVAPKLGVTRPIKGFPVWFWDFNNDGVLDLFASSYDLFTSNHQVRLEAIPADYLGLPHNTEPDCLYQGDGQGGFRDVAAEQNLKRVTLPMGANFGDLDNDGFPDFYLGTGYTFYEALMPNLLFHNRRGRGFADVTTASRMGHLQKGHGVAFADLDNDGDQDVFIELGGAFPGDAFGNALFENPGFGNHWINVKLIGTQSNRSAIGARIRVEIEEDGAKRSVYQWVNSGGSFGANPLRREIGVGQATKIDLLEVFWPTTGKTQPFRDVAVDQFIEITEGKRAYRKLPAKRLTFRTSQRSPAAKTGRPFVNPDRSEQ